MRTVLLLPGLPVLLALGGCATAQPGEPGRAASVASGDRDVPRAADADSGTGLRAKLDEAAAEIAKSVAKERARVDAFPDLDDTDADETGTADDVMDRRRNGDDETVANDPGALTDRARDQRRTAFDAYTINAHRINFVMPLSATTDIDNPAYRDDGQLLLDDLQPVEVKFQISLKSRLKRGDLFFKDDEIAFALTLEAWWQLYAKDLSSPFRESNYTPEIFYVKPLLWGPFGGSTSLFAGFAHQSNGQTQGLSRSWNRLYAGVAYERGEFVAKLRPWYRLPEKDKPSPDSPEGDDNPDILDYMGHGDLELAWRDRRREYSLLTRYNPSTGKGAAQLRITFPAFGRFRGLFEYFNGYGESLIDYDDHQQRIGLGFALTNLY